MSEKYKITLEDNKVIVDCKDDKKLAKAFYNGIKRAGKMFAMMGGKKWKKE